MQYSGTYTHTREQWREGKMEATKGEVPEMWQ